MPGDIHHSPIIEDYLSLKPGRDNDILLIIGDSAGVLQDLSDWYDIAEGAVDYDTMALNYSPLVLPANHHIDHYAAGDAHFADMQKIAATIHKPTIRHAWNRGCKNFDICWLRNGRGGWNGTSANLAIKIGLALDYTRIVLAGCPMDGSGNWYKPLLKSNDVKVNKDHRNHLWKWCEIATRPIGRFIRSMSGNTADLFGRPNREWLSHEPEIDTEGICQTTH